MKLPLAQLSNSLKHFSAAFLLGSLVMVLTGCASGKQAKPVLQRGWVGGEYKRAEAPRMLKTEPAVAAFPAQPGLGQKAGILVIALSSNTPARLAGIRESDLILELNHEPVTRMKDFRRTIDRSEPGTLLPVKLYRDGGIMECTVTMGRETFNEGGSFTVSLPFILRAPDLWPNPDFSLIALGFGRDRERIELGSPEAAYRRSCDPKGFQPADGNWRTWLVIMEVRKHKNILSQEAVAPRMARNGTPAGDAFD